MSTVAEKTNIMAAVAEWSDPEGAVEMRLKLLLRGLTGRNKVQHPDELAQFLTQCFCWPGTDDMYGSREEWNTAVTVDEGLKRLAAIARQLSGELPGETGSGSLMERFKSRTPLAAHEQAECRLRRVLELLLTPREPFELEPQSLGMRPPAFTDLYVRDVVRGVCWFQLRVEGVKPTLSGRPPREFTGPTGALLNVVVDALGLTPKSSLYNQLREVLKEQEWRAPTYGWWDNLPKYKRLR